MSGGMVLGVILESVGGLVHTLSDFLESWKQVAIFMYFGIPPWSPKAKETRKVKGKTSSRCPGDRLNQDYQSLVLRFQTSSTDD